MLMMLSEYVEKSKKTLKICCHKPFGGGCGHQLQKNEGHHVIFHAE